MSVLEIAVKESSLGVTPVDSPNWFPIPTSGSGGLSATPVKTVSNRVRADLGATQGQVAGFDVGGQYPPFEFKADQVDAYYESAMRNTFNAGVLVNGTEIQSFSIQRQFQDLTDKYMQYRGAIVTQLDLVFGNVREQVTLSPTFTALTHDNQQTTSAVGTGTIVPETTNAPITVLGLSNLSLGGVTALCLQQGSISLQNTANPVYCAGTRDASNFTLGTFLLTGSMTVHTTDDSWRYLADRDTGEGIPLTFDLGNADGNYSHLIPNVQVEFPDPTTVASGESISFQITMNAYQEDGSFTMQVTKT